MGVYEQQATGAMRTAEIYALTLILPPIAGGQRRKSPAVKSRAKRRF